ncbi:IS5 family transposase [Streptomyces avermitilis]|nr:IS5 family transposase [Streptomyces avermitilis]
MVPGGDRLLPRQGCPAGPKSGPSPVDRARPGSKHHVITDGQGIPLAVSLTGGNRNDVTQLLPLLDKIPAIAGRVGRPRRRPDALLADRGYDHDKYRRLLRARGIRPVIAKRGEPHGTGLGIFRYVVERTIAWLHGFRRLRIRWERRADIHEAFLGLAVCLITHRHVQRLC